MKRHVMLTVAVLVGAAACGDGTIPSRTATGFAAASDTSAPTIGTDGAPVAGSIGAAGADDAAAATSESEAHVPPGGSPADSDAAAITTTTVPAPDSGGRLRHPYVTPDYQPQGEPNLSSYRVDPPPADLASRMTTEEVGVAFGQREGGVFQGQPDARMIVRFGVFDGWDSVSVASPPRRIAGEPVWLILVDGLTTYSRRPPGPGSPTTAPPEIIESHVVAVMSDGDGRLLGGGYTSFSDAFTKPDMS